MKLTKKNLQKLSKEELIEVIALINYDSKYYAKRLEDAREIISKLMEKVMLDWKGQNDFVDYGNKLLGKLGK